MTELEFHEHDQGLLSSSKMYSLIHALAMQSHVCYILSLISLLLTHWCSVVVFHFIDALCEHEPKECSHMNFLFNDKQFCSYHESVKNLQN
jgi:hypothetical protein